jgi:Ser/Thr protein kinase RdoA (MazF antagonist)
MAAGESGAGVYQYRVSDQDFVLKLAKHSNKNKQTVIASLESELDWTNYLADQGVSTPRAIRSRQGRYVELIELDPHSFFSAVSWEKAAGRQITQTDFNAELFVKIGKLTGKMHALAKHYEPGQAVQKRSEWYEDGYLDIARLIPATDVILIEKGQELVHRLKKLPRDRNSYGLIHGDLQEHNLYLDNGTITVLDFEECLYSWFMCDFVSSLEAVIGAEEFGPDMETLTTFFSENYWKGYKQENNLDLFYFQQIPEFFKWWELVLYNQFINEWDLANLTKKRKRLLHNYRTDIIEGTRFATMGFEQFYHG